MKNYTAPESEALVVLMEEGFLILSSEQTSNERPVTDDDFPGGDE